MSYSSYANTEKPAQKRIKHEPPCLRKNVSSVCKTDSKQDKKSRKMNTPKKES